MKATYLDHRTTHRAPLLGSQLAALVRGADTGGSWELIELTVGPGGASPLHTLAGDKAFYVADGRITLVVGDERREAVAGDAAHVPAGTPHRYLNESGEPARLLVVTSGGGHVEFLEGMSRLTAGGPPDVDELAAHTAAHHVRLLA